MKKLIALVCVILAAPSALAVENYTAKMNEEGEYCARVKQTTVGATFTFRTKCRTLEEWKANGYKVTNPQNGQEVEI